MKFSELQRLQRREGITVLSADERIEQLEARLRTATKERDALRAKIEQREKQEPVAWLHETRRDSDVVTDAVKHVWGKAAVGSMAAYSIPLYALPGAQGLASSQDEWRTLAKDLLREIERQTCAHEETHRGGFLWEICDACGAKWADDEGGKPEFKWPKVVEKARAMLEDDPGAKGDEK